MIDRAVFRTAKTAKATRVKYYPPRQSIPTITVLAPPKPASIVASGLFCLLRLWIFLPILWAL
jgi:hypothetical protein